MQRYLLDRDALRSGERAVHAEGCVWLALVRDSLDLGFHARIESAVAQAVRILPGALACSACTDVQGAAIRGKRGQVLDGREPAPEREAGALAQHAVEGPNSRA